ncbi:MAG: tRNA pseudouridine(13) synthase TruD [Sulfurimonas sp.]|nr:tRNA pseudouridine(13) synthase TruD [Sulfurimonas sp.]MDQ7061612.1 tRNA pseudouridine(13) synthase TruD [Sulfurimonas sp.]
MSRDYELPREYLQNGEVMDFDFEQNEKDFVVDEIPHVKYTSNKGNFLILHVKKVEMTTWDMIAVFAKTLDVPAEKIGYAGLKDKHATTTQYISVEVKFEKALKKFRHKHIKIIATHKHKHAIRMGDLAGNRFHINLYGVDNIEAGRIDKLSLKAAKSGLPNYFGYQRFGRDGDSIEQAKAMIDGELHVEDAKLKKFLISIYQSVFFNEWLRERVLLSREKNAGKYMLLSGDIYQTEDGKIFTPKQIPNKDFADAKVMPTGLLCGRNVYRARDEAREIEEKYDDLFLYEKGLRRAAIIFPKDIESKYNKDFSVYSIAFTLPKGAYATVFLENIGNRNLKAKKIKVKSKK